MLFPLERLIDRSEKPDLMWVRQDGTIREALECMIENDFSQLPVVDKDDNLLGIISERRITRMYYHLIEGVSLLDLKVDHCTAPAVTLPPDRDLFEALNRLKDKDVYAIVVTKNNKPVGILTDYDMTQFFRDLSEGLIFIEDIEVTLRQYIQKAFPDEHSLMAALMTAFKPDRRDPSRPAKEFEELSFYDYIQLITNERNWSKFKGIFEPTDMFVKLMEPVRQTRNKLAHFRGRLNSIQRDALIQALNWLANRPKAEISKVVSIPASAALAYSTDMEGGTYRSLQNWLQEQRKNKETNIRVKFQDIETLLGETLPSSAKEHQSWWGNDYIDNKQSLSWLQAGWRVEDVDLSAEEVTFHRTDDILRQLFFADLLARLKAARPDITRAERTLPQSWWQFGAGRSGFAFAWTFTYDVHKNPVLRVELYIDTDEREENNRVFNALLNQKESIEKEMGTALNWQQLEDTKRGACRISLTRLAKFTDPPEEIEQAKRWALETMLKFVVAFRGRIKKL
jgi:CBS domain-containing protein